MSFTNIRFLPPIKDLKSQVRTLTVGSSALIPKRNRLKFQTQKSLFFSHQKITFNLSGILTTLASTVCDKIIRHASKCFILAQIRQNQSSLISSTLHTHSQIGPGLKAVLVSHLSTSSNRNFNFILQEDQMIYTASNVVALFIQALTIQDKSSVYRQNFS